MTYVRNKAVKNFLRQKGFEVEQKVEALFVRNLGKGAGSLPLRSWINLVNSWSFPYPSTASLKSFQPMIAEKCRYGSPRLFGVISVDMKLVEKVDYTAPMICIILVNLSHK
jgi:hypothetical protein